MSEPISKEILESISIPDFVDTRIGALEFTNGVPSKDAVAKAYDHLDFLHGVNVYLNAFPAASTYALHKGFLEAGAQDNSVLMFSELMDSQSLFLTANSDTVYFVGIINLADGPMVVETPPQALGIFDDMWFHWLIDFGLPGPDRGEGGRFLLVGPGYDGALPDSGFHVAHSRTTRALMLGRSFINENPGNAPGPTVDLIKGALKLYPYVPGGHGTSVATLLGGEVRPGVPVPPRETTFVEASGKAFNTIPPSDFGFFEMVNALIQDEPADSADPEILGQLEAIGIVKGKPFAPDARMRRTLEQAAEVGHATSRALLFDPRESEGFAYYPESSWSNSLFVGGYNFETPPPLVTSEGVQPLPPTGSRKLHGRTNFFYGFTGITPAMCMRLAHVGSQYVWAFMDADKNFLDGSRTYRVTLPRDIPEERFWSLTLYDNETRSLLQTPQRFPRAGSQSYPTPAAETEADGSTVVTFSPEKPQALPAGNWIQTVPGKGFFVILRLYSPLQPFFDRSWRVGEIELET